MSKLTTLDQLKSGLQAAKTYIDAQDTALTGRINDVVEDVEKLVAAKGEANVLTGVKVNGAALSITDKMVDILIASGAENGTISVNGAAVAVAGLVDLAYKSEITENELSEALKASIAAKATKADLDALTVRVGSIESAGYQTAEQVAEAINKANHLKYEIADSAPSAEQADPNTWYMVYNDQTNHYDIYGLLNGTMQVIDDTTVDLTGYAKTEVMQEWVTQQIAALNIDQYATDADLKATVTRIAAVEAALTDVYTKSEIDAKLDTKMDKAAMDEYATDAEAAAAAAAAVADATATDTAVNAAIDSVFGSAT